MTGNKLENKMYRKHTGYPGGLKETSYSKILSSKLPDIKLSVKRMLRRGTGAGAVKKLHVYSGNDHPHNAPKIPEPIDFQKS